MKSASKEKKSGHLKNSERTATTRERILEVGDDEAVREFIAAICKNRGFDVVQARCGDEALNSSGMVLPDSRQGLRIRVKAEYVGVPVPVSRMCPRFVKGSSRRFWTRGGRRKKPPSSHSAARCSETSHVSTSSEGSPHAGDPRLFFLIDRLSSRFSYRPSPNRRTAPRRSARGCPFRWSPCWRWRERISPSPRPDPWTSPLRSSQRYCCR